MRRSACEGEAGDEAFSLAWASEIQLQPLSCYWRLACQGPSLRNQRTRARGPSISKASWVQFLHTSSQCMPANQDTISEMSEQIFYVTCNKNPNHLVLKLCETLNFFRGNREVYPFVRGSGQSAGTDAYRHFSSGMT